MPLDSDIFQTSAVTKDQIRDAWESLYDESLQVFGSVSESDFTAERDGRWTLAKNLDHLTRSGLAVAKALALPKFLIRLLFGKSSQSRSLPEIRDTYLQVLADGGEARGRFKPTGTESQANALREWEHCSRLLMDNLNRWSESQLDTLRLPHPLLGKLTVREMLFFTLYHTQHHLQNVRQ